MKATKRVGNHFLKTREQIRHNTQVTAVVSELITVENSYNPTLNYRHYMIPALMIILYYAIQM